MKKFFVVALAAIGMVACVQNETVDIVKSDVIAFDGAYVSNSTRAEVDGAADPSFEDTKNPLQAFKVWAFMNENDGSVFSEELVELKGTVWGYDNIQYWMPGNTYYFAGVAPVENAHWAVSNGDAANLYPIDVIDFANVDGSEDLLYAYATVETPQTLAEINAGMASVKMQFKHLLSKVKFTFQNGFATNNVKVEVRDVKMVVPASGSINVVSNEWVHTAATTTLEFGATEKINANGDKHEIAQERLTIPTNDFDYAISFTIDVWQGEQLAYTVEKQSTITGLAFEQGLAYNLTATITPENLELKPIEFAAVVTPWVETTPDLDFDIEGTTVYVETIDALQAALNAATGSAHNAISRAAEATTYTIKVAKDLKGDVFVDQVEGVNVVIDGRGYAYDGTIYLHGGARHTGAESLTIKNINFAHEDGTIDFISCNDAQDGHNRYAHNVTVEGCTFEGNANGDVVALRFRQCYNIVVKDVEATNVHSLLWATGSMGMVIDNATVANSQYGVSFGTSNNVVVKNSNIEASAAYGYAVRAKANGAYNLTLANNTLKAEVPVLLREASNKAYVLTLEGDNTLTTTKYEGYQIAVSKTDYSEDVPTLDKPDVMPRIYGAYNITAIFPEATEADTADEFVGALEAGEDVVMTDDVKIEPAGMSNAYGTTGINVKNGQTVDGGGNILDIKGAGGTWDSGISTTGGVIKNITVTGSFRGIFINHNSAHCEKVVLENVIIDGTVYTISCDQGTYQGLEATDCVFNGWTSYAATLGDAKFVNCSFGEGSGYAYCRPYAPTEFVGCAFEKDFTVNPRAAIVFDGCTLDGVALTSDNIAELIAGNMSHVTVK